MEKPVTELTEDEIKREWEGFMWAEAVGEFKITEEQTNRHIEIEREIARREA